jgi:GT2 family glycosyltransferase
MALSAAIPVESRLAARPASPALVRPGLSVVIVNYCQWDETAALVRQLLHADCLRRGLAEVVVVDNHSPPAPGIGALRRWEGVSLRRWGRNRGFGLAANEGCRLARGDWLLLLNPDVDLPADFLDRLHELSERIDQELPGAGVVGLGLRNSDGSRQHSAGAFPSLWSTLAGRLLPRARRKYRPLPGRRRRRVAWVSGCGMLLRRDCLRQLGGFDPRFFLYYEDVDLCRRARAFGWSVWYQPEPGLVHREPLHGRPVSAPLHLLVRHALLAYAHRHWPRWQFLILAGIVRLETWWRQLRAPAPTHAVLTQVVRDLVAGRADQARQRVENVAQELPKPTPRSPVLIPHDRAVDRHTES